LSTEHVLMITFDRAETTRDALGALTGFAGRTAGGGCVAKLKDNVRDPRPARSAVPVAMVGTGVGALVASGAIVAVSP